VAIPNQFGDNDQQQADAALISTDQALVSWVVSRVKRARDVRDGMYGERWKEYTRLWRGMWSPNDKNTASERSKLISPALSQAIEMTVSEIEEAMFGRKAWFDIDDDIRDEQKEDAVIVRDQLLEDIDLTGAQDALSKAFLIGAIYGTGIIKINVDVIEDRKLGPDGEPLVEDKVVVPLEAIRPEEFVIDPSATTIDEALFCAHEVIKPLHSIEQKQARGKYKKGFIAPYAGIKPDTTGTGQNASARPEDDSVLITEYYGKIPARFLEDAEDTAGLIEAIIVVANEATLLKAVANPFTMQDRPIIAYQHDTVPGEFWGRGVAEKGYNPQKALDSELRARVDGLALITAPMLGADITRMGRNPDLRVRPGKVFLTRGRPSEILEPVGFTPQGLALTFQQSGDLERMVQMGTGAMDSATPLGQNRRNETASGMSMLQASFLKRSKRSMQNIERRLIHPLLRRMLWRYMQFDPERYPADYKFKVNAAMGIMAKEVENQQLVQMLGFTPPESPAHGIILKALFDNTTSSEKQELMQAIEAMNQPPSPEQQQMQQKMQQLQMAMAEAELRKTQAEAGAAEAQAQLSIAKAKHEMIKAEFVDDNVEIQAANAAVNAEQARIARENVNVNREKAKAQANKPRSK
jgi:hypothetical protein